MKPTCADPRLGARATLSLSRPPSPALMAHLATCLACRLERHEFDMLATGAKTSSSGLVARLRKTAR